MSSIIQDLFERRRLDQERKRSEAEENREKQEKKLKLEQLKKQEEKKLKLKQYQELRKAIELMPKYTKWKNDVFEKNGKRCDICGQKDNLEIHHRISFFSLIQKYNITDIYKAFECDYLWDVNNGSVVCRFCHERTSSYQYRSSILNKQYDFNQVCKKIEYGLSDRDSPILEYFKAAREAEFSDINRELSIRLYEKILSFVGVDSNLLIKDACFMGIKRNLLDLAVASARKGDKYMATRFYKEYLEKGGDSEELRGRINEVLLDLAASNAKEANMNEAIHYYKKYVEYGGSKERASYIMKRKRCGGERLKLFINKAGLSDYHKEQDKKTFSKPKIEDILPSPKKIDSDVRIEYIDM